MHRDEYEQIPQMHYARPYPATLQGKSERGRHELRRITARVKLEELQRSLMIFRRLTRYRAR